MRISEIPYRAACAMLVAGAAFAQGYPNKTDTLHRAVAARRRRRRAVAHREPEVERGARPADHHRQPRGRRRQHRRRDWRRNPPPDGYTIVFAYAGTHGINPSIYSKLPFKESDFAPIIWMAEVPQVLVVHPSLPVKTVKDVIALAKAKPDQLTYGSSGSGAMNHLTGALFAMMTNTKIVHVPYKGGGPAAIALLSGEISMIFGEPATVVQQIKAGKVRAIAVTSAKHALALPDLPTVAEGGVPGYEVTSWNGILAPAATPPDIVRRLNAELNKIIAAPDMRQRMIDNGFEPVGGPPEKFGDKIRAEIAKWAPVVKAAGVKVD